MVTPKRELSGKSVTRADQKSRDKTDQSQLIVNRRIVLPGCVLKLLFLSDEEL